MSTLKKSQSGKRAHSKWVVTNEIADDSDEKNLKIVQTEFERENNMQAEDSVCGEQAELSVSKKLLEERDTNYKKKFPDGKKLDMATKSAFAVFKSSHKNDDEPTIRETNKKVEMYQKVEKDHPILKRKYQEDEEQDKPLEKSSKSSDTSRHSPSTHLAIEKIRSRTYEDTKFGHDYLILVDGEQCCLKGRAYFRVVHGSVDILGAEFSASDTWNQVYSVVTSALATLTAKGDSSRIKNEYLPPNTHTKLLTIQKEAKKKVTVICIKRCDEGLNLLDYVNKTDLHTFMFDLCGGESVISLKQSGVEVLFPSDKTPAVDFRRSVREDIGRILSTSSDDCPKVLICGGKNVGKSTLGRYCVNKLLAKWKQVAFFECDLGQTEFTPSGCVSLTMITEVIHGVPATHLQTPKKCIFYGSLSPVDDPLGYMECVANVWKFYQKQFSHCPVIINTMGWNKGLGLSLLAEQICLMRPDYVLQIESNADAHNLPMMSAENVKPSSQMVSHDKAPTLHHKLIMIPSTVDANNRALVHTRPAEHRALTLLSYFSALDDRLWNVIPYTVPFHNVAVHVSHTKVPNNHVLYALNGAVVALCSVDENLVLSTEMPDSVKFLAYTPRNADCLGFGLVRAIDPEKRIFYIVTPVTKKQLVKVNALIKGAVDFHEDVTMKQKITAPLYVDQMVSAAGSNRTQPRRHMSRSFRTPQQ